MWNFSGSGSKNAGMLAVVVSLDRIVELLRTASVRDRTYFVVDVHGHIVAHPETHDFVPGMDVSNTSPVVARFKELPMEFAVEAQKLLGVSLEGSVGLIPLEGATGRVLQSGESVNILPSGELDIAKATGAAPVAAPKQTPLPEGTPNPAEQASTTQPPPEAPVPPVQHKDKTKEYILIGVIAGGAVGIAAGVAGAGHGHSSVSPSTP